MPGDLSRCQRGLHTWRAEQTERMMVRCQDCGGRTTIKTAYWWSMILNDKERARASQL